jgi:hypothetical protein
MHDLYQQKQVQRQIKAAYKANPLPSVQLQGFLQPAVYAKLLKACAKAKYKETVIADRYSRFVAPLPKDAQFFASKEFAAFVKQITGKQVTGKPHLEYYTHRNYTLRNDEEKPPGLFVYFDCTARWHAGWGGATIISNETGELARVQPLPNALVLIDCSKAWPFVQYVNHYAGKQRILRLSWT